MNDTRNPGFDLPLSLETIEKFDQVGVQIGKCVTVLEEHQEFLVGERDRHAPQPYCKIIQHYLRAHHAPDLLDLSFVDRNELLRILSKFFSRLKKESEEMLAVYGVHDEHDLAANQREIYYTRMKALVEDLDHYP